MAAVKNIPIDQIAVPEVRITAVYDEELEHQLADSLTATGQIVPIIVVQAEEGYELVDGRHRLDDAKRRGNAKIEAKVLPGDSVTALLYNIATNRLRGKTKVSELVLVIDELVHKRGLDVDQIQERTGLTRDYIERLWKIGEASPLVVEALDKELIGVGVAFELSRLPARAQQEMYLNTVQTFHMTVKDAKGQVDGVLEAMAEPAPPPVQVVHVAPVKPTCEVCRDEAPPNLLVAVQLDPKCYGKLQVLVDADRPPPAPAEEPPANPPSP